MPAPPNVEAMFNLIPPGPGPFQEAVPEQNPIPGAVIAIQTFGDFLGFNPHCHVLVTDGCFYGSGISRVAPPLDLKKLEAIFRHKVFKMLLAKGRITKDLIAMLSNWRHSGFQVFCGNRISPKDETAMENLARYILRAAFSQERELYLAEPSKVVYRAKDGTEEKIFDALEWLAAMCSHIPDRGESRRWREYGTMGTTVPRFAGSPGENGKKAKRTGSLTGLAQSLKTPPRHLYPENPPNLR